jgi:hypothetical protein
MGERELREKYGGKLAKAINRAIRAEVPGGNEALDRLMALSGPAMHSRWTDRRGVETPEAAAYYRHKRSVVDPMEAAVRKAWGLPPAGDEKRPVRPPRQRAGKPRTHPTGKRKPGRPR